MADEKQKRKVTALRELLMMAWDNTTYAHSMAGILLGLGVSPEDVTAAIATLRKREGLHASVYEIYGRAVRKQMRRVEREREHEKV